MKMMRSGVRLLWRFLRFFGVALHPRNALPCVGLVVLGGCLTFIISPDETPAPGVDQAWEAKGELPLVILDPGHGGKDEGTRWRGISERDLSLDLAFRVQRLLRSAGFKTMLTRDSDVYVSLVDRARIANAQRNAVFVSIHFNSENTATSNGIETYFAKTKDVPVSDWSWVGVFNKGEPVPVDSSEELAGSIQTALVGRTEAKNRGIHQSNFYVVHHTRCPSVLVEGGFISNVFESQMLSTETYREILAQGIAEGLVNFQKSRQQRSIEEPPPTLVKQ